MSDGCPKCHGPVEVTLNFVGSHNEVSPTRPNKYRALPDTLEGIEGDAKAAPHSSLGVYVVLKNALTRLFNDCTACDRQPQIIRAHMGFAIQAVTEGKRKGLLRAADMADEIDKRTRDTLFGKFAAELRKLAEET